MKYLIKDVNLTSNFLTKSKIWKLIQSPFYCVLIVNGIL